VNANEPTIYNLPGRHRRYKDIIKAFLGGVKIISFR
jgi:hypothetical protein